MNKSILMRFWRPLAVVALLMVPLALSADVRPGDFSSRIDSPITRVAEGPGPTSVSWGAIFAGAAAALALQLLLTTLGAGIGAAAIDPYDRNNPVGGVPTGALVWWLVTGLISLFVGGFVAGKLSGATTESPATMAIGGLHGMVMWSLSAVLTYILVATTGASLIRGAMGVLIEGVSLAGKGVGAVASVAGPAVGGLVQSVVPSFDWEKVKREVRALLRDTGKANPDKEFNLDPLAHDEELGSLLQSVYGQARDAIQSGDRDALVNMISARTGKNKDEINKALEKVEKTYQDVKKEFNDAMIKAEQKARDAAAATASVVSRVATWTAVALVGGMIVATIGATLGVSRPTMFLFW